ncbi:glycosyltransferase family 1 protein [Thermomonas sp. HDW16]|uniref:glycosyltransferase family 4 protein n=1 Tax=Thermomonas sp. HDW16 TaxID=2714945 RepID=UPI001408867F|nr:glycosyltransferase family 1 protein [Thermomonas sp. HDW16]QIL21046.1 glycosyltransferase family 1 protein [Thermomonas sp. HDW16]
MRYAIVTETYPPEVNGVALTVQGLEQGLRERGHDVELVRPRQDGDGGPAADTLLVRGAGLPRYPGLKFGLPATRTLRKRWQLARPDAIYVATEGPLGWSALRAARQLGIPAATGFHTRFDDYMRDYGAPWLQGVALRWMRRFHNGAQATLVPTRELQEFLQGEGFDNVVRLARAVDTQQFDPTRRDRELRAQWRLGDRDVAAIYVGRIAAEKNLPLAVRAFRELQKMRPDAKFVWVGDGPARAQLQRDNPDFIFCGVQRGDDLARHFASGDLFVFASHSETFGNVTLEALASGVPTVAFDYGAAREILRNDIHGAAIRDGDDAGFIDAVARIGSDDLLRSAMRMTCREAVSTLRPAQVAEDFDHILQSLANDGGSHVAAAAT